MRQRPSKPVLQTIFPYLRQDYRPWSGAGKQTGHRAVSVVAGGVEPMRVRLS